MQENYAPEPEETTSDFAVAEYDKLIDLPKSVDESILMGTSYVKPVTDTDTGSGSGSGSGSGVNIGALPSYTSNMNLKMATHIYKNAIKSSPDILDNAVNNLATSITSTCYFGDTTSHEPQRAIQIIKEQIYKFIAILFSFIIILNWWFLWNYTNFTFNFETLLNFPPFSILFYIFEPSFKVIELLNYYLITRRMDADVSSSSRLTMRSIWDYRPLVFAFFASIIMGGCHAIPFGSIFIAIFTGDSAGISGLVMGLTVLMYLSVTINPNRIREFMFYFFWFPPIIIFVVLLLMLLVIAFSGFTTILFAVYLFALSNFSLLFFNGLNPFSVVGSINQIYTDLAEAPVDDPNTKEAGKKLMNHVFRNAHMLMILSVVIAMFVKNAKDALTLTNWPTIIFIIFGLNSFLIYMISATLWPFIELATFFAKAIIDGWTSTADYSVEMKELEFPEIHF